MQWPHQTTPRTLFPDLYSARDTLPTSSCTPTNTPSYSAWPQPHSPPPASPALRQWEEQGELLLPLIFLLLVLGSLLLYLAVSLMDPGYVNVQPQPQVTSGPLGA